LPRCSESPTDTSATFRGNIDLEADHLPLSDSNFRLVMTGYTFITLDVPSLGTIDRMPILPLRKCGLATRYATLK
jgi:hypothetical protein